MKQLFKKGNTVWKHPNCIKTQFKKGHKPTYNGEALKKYIKEHGSWNKGKKALWTTKRNLENNPMTKIREHAGTFKKEQEPWNKGITGPKSHFWQGGKSFEPYGIEFNKQLKLQIRQRDNFTCQECGFTEKKLGYKLRIHHIDYNKKNNKPKNLISLCKSCHSKTGFNREDWTDYFKEKTNWAEA